MQISVAPYALYKTEMDSIDPVCPPFSSSSETNASEGSSSQAYPGPNPSLPTAAAGPSSLRSSNLPAQLPRPEPHLYSPTRAEIESHPIRQRLSLGRDEIATGYGTAPEAISENRIAPLEPGLLDSRQAQEGSNQLFDAMSSEAPAVKEGDAGTFILRPLVGALG
jgi:hypothetical protein